MRLAHRVHTRATAAQVWQVLGDPQAWPTFDPFLWKVRGGPARTGQHLVGIARVGRLRIPLDVVEAVPGRRLVLRVHTAPGVRETVTHEITPAVRGGCDLEVSVVVEGLFARLAVAPLYLASGLTARLLAARTDSAARAARRAA
ncbi:MAG: SRPBCC family protein [Frankiales bacterium]|nr:SRPBCC family protein [Frankiales bacterium]